MRIVRSWSATYKRNSLHIIYRLFPAGAQMSARFFWVGHQGIAGKAIILRLFSLSSFAYPKEETRKRHPSQSWPCGRPLLLAGGGTRRNSGFALKQSESPPLCGFAYLPRLFPPSSARRGRTNGGGRNSHWHAAEHRRGCRKGDLHCLSAANLQSPGSIEERRVSRLRRDKCLGALSLVRFFGQAKK